MSKDTRKHRTSLRNTWSRVKDRCLNEKGQAYRKYGAKGITVEKSWLNFENFYSDMVESYEIHLNKHGKKQTTIDRINSKGNYSKENCRWATYAEQNSNRSINHYRTYKGDRMILRDFYEKYGRDIGITFGSFKGRINQLKWSIKKTIETPKLKHFEPRKK